MYNLLLVDDEQFILDGLAYNIDWDQLEIGEVFLAGNADSALQILGEHRIDLIISDVRMPGMDGISMSEIVQSRWPYTKLIFLSGYNDFEYARRAIGVHAFRYILKPVRYEELQQIVREAIEELEKDFQKRSVVREAQDKLREMQPFLEERFLNLWLEKDRIHPLDNPQEETAAGLSFFPADQGFWISVKVEKWLGQTVNDGIMSMALPNLARLILQENHRLISYLSLSGIHNFLLLGECGEDFELFFRRTVERLETFQYSVAHSLECESSVFWDYPAPLCGLGESYRRLQQRIRGQSGWWSGAISGPVRSGSPDLPGLKSLHSHPSFLTLINNLQREQAMQWLENTFSELGEASLQTQDNILRVYHAVTGALISDSSQRNIRLSEWAGNLQEFFESAHTAASVEAFHDCCREAVTRYLDFVVRSQSRQGAKLVEKIKTKLHEQISDSPFSADSSVSGIARQFNYNPIYLSRVFKEETGMSLQDYIIQIRIDKAKTLLNSGARISDVALQVGYENFPHFSRLFKKTVGVSPKQFQGK